MSSSPSGMPSHLSSSSSDPLDLSLYLHSSSFDPSPSPTFSFSPLPPPWDSPSPPSLSPPPFSHPLPPPISPHPALNSRTTPVHRPKPSRPSAFSAERAAEEEIRVLRQYLASSTPSTRRASLSSHPYQAPRDAGRRRSEGELGVRKVALGVGGKKRREAGLGGTLEALREAEERAGRRERNEVVGWAPIRGVKGREGQPLEVAIGRWPNEWRDKGMGAWGLSFGVVKG